MGVVASAAATKIIGEIAKDLVAASVDATRTGLAKWKNVNAHRQLARKLATVELVKTFWQRDKSVRLSEFYYPNRVTIGNARPISATSLASLPAEGNFVIQGTIGQGKSIFLRHLCAQELTVRGTKRIPLLIELRSVTSKGLMHEIELGLKKLGFTTNDTLVDFYLRTGKIVLLLDAFDELDEDLISTALGEMESLAEIYDKLQMFVTSRPQSAIQNSRHFHVIKLASLAPTDHEPFLRRIGLTEAEAKRLLSATQTGSSEVYKLLTTPLLMTLLVVVYKSEQSIPTEIPEFYQKLFETLFSKHDSAKPAFKRKHKSGLSERKLQQIFEAFCFCVLQLRLKTKLTGDEFTKAFEQASKHTSHVLTVEVEGFRHDIVHVTCLMQEEGYDIHFLHKSVLEFFAASFVASRTETQARRFYEQLPGRWFHWTQVLQFLSQIDRYRFLKYFEIPSIDAFFAEIGYRLSDNSNDPRHLADRVYGDVKIGFIVVKDEIDFHNFELGRIYHFRPASRVYAPIIEFVHKAQNDGYRKFERMITNRLPEQAAQQQMDLGQTIDLTWNEAFNPGDREAIGRSLLGELRRFEDDRQSYLRYLHQEDQKADLISI